MHLIEYGAANARGVHHQCSTGQLVDEVRDALDHLRVRRAQRKPLEVADVEIRLVDLGHGKGRRVLGLTHVRADYNHNR